MFNSNRRCTGGVLPQQHWRAPSRSCASFHTSALCTWTNNFFRSGSSSSLYASRNGMANRVPLVGHDSRSARAKQSGPPRTLPRPPLETSHFHHGSISPSADRTALRGFNEVIITNEDRQVSVDGRRSAPEAYSAELWRSLLREPCPPWNFRKDTTQIFSTSSLEAPTMGARQRPPRPPETRRTRSPSPGQSRTDPRTSCSRLQIMVVQPMSQRRTLRGQRMCQSVAWRTRRRPRSEATHDAPLARAPPSRTGGRRSSTGL